MTPEEAIAALNKITGWNASDLSEAVHHVGIKIAGERSLRWEAQEEAEKLRELRKAILDVDVAIRSKTESKDEIHPTPDDH